MQLPKTMLGLAVTAAVGASLSSCGNSQPQPATSAAPASAPVGAASVTTNTNLPAAGTFAPESSTLRGDVSRVVQDCNIDSIDGKPVDGASLARASDAVFAGWAADSATGTVPDRVQVVLRGAQGRGDFALEAATGVTRTDVAKARNVPAFAASGWSVQANLSAVPPGRYDAVLMYSIAGEPITCDPHHALTVR